MEIQESYANIQVVEWTTTTVEEFNKNVPIIVNNHQIQDMQAANINNAQLGVIMPLTQDIQEKNENVSLMESTGGIDDNDKSVNLFKIVKKLFVKSAKTKKISPNKLLPESKGNNVVWPAKQPHGSVYIVICRLLTSLVQVTLLKKEAREFV